MNFKSIGQLLVFPEKVILAVDPGIAEFYRSLIPKHHNVKKGKYPPHITIARCEPISDKWKRWSNYYVLFEYDPYIQNNGSVYWWLNAKCLGLNALRVMCDLDVWSEKSRPPDGSENFHITIGNTK